MAKRAVFERSRRELSLDVSVGVHTLLVVEQSSLESQSRGCAKSVNKHPFTRLVPNLNPSFIYYAENCLPGKFEIFKISLRSISRFVENQTLAGRVISYLGTRTSTKNI